MFGLGGLALAVEHRVGLKTLWATGEPPVPVLMPSCHIFQSWRGGHCAARSWWIGSGGTHTRKGLHIHLDVDDNDYPAGVKAHDAAPGD
jgi:hypothetical protein